MKLNELIHSNIVIGDLVRSNKKIESIEQVENKEDQHDSIEEISEDLFDVSF